jgi:hypothetical protein
LERLSTKVKDPDQLEAALSGVKQFNKQPNFYTEYAKNFIMKSVKKGSDSDPRVGYIRQVKDRNERYVCASCQVLLKMFPIHTTGFHSDQFPRVCVEWR